MPDLMAEMLRTMSPEQANQALIRAEDAFEQYSEVSGPNGTDVLVDNTNMRAALMRAIPGNPQVSGALAKYASDIASRRLATSDAGEVLFPWQSLMTPDGILTLGEPALREAGFSDSSGGEALLVDLAATNPEAPVEQLNQPDLISQISDVLATDTAFWNDIAGCGKPYGLRLPNGEPSPFDPKPTPPPSPTPLPLPEMADVNKMLECFRRAGGRLRWYGWRIDLTPDCGNLLSNMIRGAAWGRMSVSLLAGLKSLIATKSFAVALGASASAAGGVITLALVAYAVYLALAIRYNLASNGVSLNGLWPPLAGVIWARGIH
jgi:hypothetical protein